jgi:glycosyltransferase involved in cell wall biosynthesis
MNPIRLTVAATHPVQYMSPWFRHVTTHCPEVELTVVYAARPTPAQQSVGFGRPFAWDTPLLDGYSYRVVRDQAPGRFDSESFRGLDVPELPEAVVGTEPDVVLVAGWNSVTLVRVIAACRRRRIPLIYRGDTHLGARPSGWRGPAWTAKTRAMLRAYSAWLAVGVRSRDYLVAHGASPTRIYASPHAVDNGFFAAAAAPHLTHAGRRAARAVYGVRPEDFVALFVGKVSERKRVLDAIRTVGRLGSDAALLIVGAGDDEPRAREEAERLGVRVAWAGFQNQTELGRAYAAADCLVVPSDFESWGLVVNEAMATGLPAVVSDGVGCRPDLIEPGVTGEVAAAGDVEAMAAALARVRDCGGRSAMAEACRERVSRFTFERASVGLVAACQALAARRPRAPRVIACCGGMVVVSGLERMTFEVLRVVRARGGAVHCVVNEWENFRIVDLAERAGASWSIGRYNYDLNRASLSPLRLIRSVASILVTSAGLLRDAARFRATHVLVPEHAIVLRNAPALALLRLFGVRIVFRIANAPERGRLYDLLWRLVLPPLVTTFVPNSRFSYGRLQETGVPERKITLIRNALSRRAVRERTDDDVVRLAAARRTVLTVGQIAPFKGTHLTIEAVARLVSEGHDAQAIVVGAIPAWPPELVAYARDLAGRARELGVDDRVHFVGPRENVLAIMRASYVLAAPILQEETFGNVVLEARSVGLPVVAFARGGIGELVTDGETGVLCRAENVDGLVEGLRRFFERPAERARASANSLAAAAAGDDTAPVEFERRWWALFARAS